MRSVGEYVDEGDHNRSISPDKPEVGAHPAVCPVVGLGASAGGLEAFQAFFASASAEAGLAYVLVQHLDPNHESMLAELLSRRTEMRVRQIEDDTPIEPNNVYLIPPNASLVVEKARLRLHDFSEPRGFRRPIDVFFRSLAVDQGSNAACVVLSGTGGDGSDGLRAVKEAGGLTIVQDPETAKYDGMPRSAVATGLVDKVLSVAEMPGAIREYFDHGQSALPSIGPGQEDFLLKVCARMRDRLGHDFSQYKRSTMLRRVHRRMQVVGLTQADEYLDRLASDAMEADLLFRDLLINVTCFFRDAEAFNFLRREVIPQLLANKGAGDTIRIWGPGCSSGEEAYSIAILMAEALSRRKDRPTVQIFATDIDEPMLQKARLARYPHSAVRDVPIELFDRYFYAHDDDYVLVQAIRDMVRISNHNLIKDPPFSRCDLVVCRNLLIYLNSNLQQRLIPVFHYALRQDGWLFLGTADNIASRSDLFTTCEPTAKIYRRRGSMRQSVPMPILVEQGGSAARRRVGEGTRDLAELTARRIMDRYAPAHVVVDADNVVIRSSSRTGRYLELAEGLPSSRVTDLARRGLRSAVRSVLDGVRGGARRAVKKDVRLEVDDEQVSVNVVAERLENAAILLVFQDARAVRSEADPDTAVSVDDFSEEERLKELEDELAEAQSTLRTTVEELETSNEELKSSNEEMMSMNEELQSTNEELATVNEELKNKVDQLARANSDLQNFIASTEIPTIFLDRNLRIRSFTPATRGLFRFQEQDKGRDFLDVVSRADQRHIAELARRVLDEKTAIEEEIGIPDTDECYMLRVLPYREVNGSIDGIILVFSDVTKIRQTQADLARNVAIGQQRSHEIETIYKTATVGMALVDRNSRFVKINQQFADLNGASIDDHIGRRLEEMVPAISMRLERPIAEVFKLGKEVTNLEITTQQFDCEALDFLIDVFPYEQGGRVTAVGIIIKNVTEVRKLEKDLRHLMDELQHRVKNTLATVASIINQTVATKTDRKDIANTLKERIGALAATHNLLTTHDWRDVSLRDILQAELSPYDAQQKVVLEGPQVALPPKHALSLTLTLHELATNAAKYGALAHSRARLAVKWSVTTDVVGRRLVLEWIESGGPEIDASSVQQSFGTRLIKNAVVHDLQGQCDYQFERDGVVCTLTVPF